MFTDSEDGFIALIGSFIGGSVGNALFLTLARDSTAPTLALFLFSLISTVGILATIKQLTGASFCFLLGWVIGALCIWSSLSGWEQFVYVGTPALVVVLRARSAIFDAE